jgi:hypothetical protein
VYITLTQLLLHLYGYALLRFCWNAYKNDSFRLYTLADPLYHTRYQPRNNFWYNPTCSLIVCLFIQYQLIIVNSLANYGKYLPSSGQPTCRYKHLCTIMSVLIILQHYVGQPIATAAEVVTNAAQNINHS